MEVVNVEDEVEISQVDAETTNSKVLLADVHDHVVAHAGAGHAIAVGHRDSHVAVPCDQPDAAHDTYVDEVVGQAAVEEGKELVTVDVDMEVHSLLGVDACEGIEGDNQGNGWLLLQGRHDSRFGRHIVDGVIHQEVDGLQEEQVWALMAPHIGLIAVEA